MLGARAQALLGLALIVGFLFGVAALCFYRLDPSAFVNFFLN